MSKIDMVNEPVVVLNLIHFYPLKTKLVEP